MDTSNPLAELKDIHLPTEVPLFPLAVGWYLLLTLIIILAIAFVWYRQRQKKHAQYIRAIEQLFDDLEANQANLIDAEIIANASILLKRVAATKFPAQSPEYLAGLEWLEFLDKTGKTNDFTNGHGKYLMNIYQLQTLTHRDEFFDILRKWLRTVL